MLTEIMENLEAFRRTPEGQIEQATSMLECDMRWLRSLVEQFPDQFGTVTERIEQACAQMQECLQAVEAIQSFNAIIEQNRKAGYGAH